MKRSAVGLLVALVAAVGCSGDDDLADCGQRRSTPAWAEPTAELDVLILSEDGSSVEARDPATGEIRWSWEAGEADVFVFETGVSDTHVMSNPFSPHQGVIDMTNGTMSLNAGRFGRTTAVDECTVIVFDGTNRENSVVDLPSLEVRIGPTKGSLLATPMKDGPVLHHLNDTLEMLDRRTGDALWTVQIPTRATALPARDSVVINHAATEVAAYDYDTGQEIWSSSLPGGHGYLIQPYILHESIVVFGSSSSESTLIVDTVSGETLRDLGATSSIDVSTIDGETVLLYVSAEDAVSGVGPDGSDRFELECDRCATGPFDKPFLDGKALIRGALVDVATGESVWNRPDLAASTRVNWPIRAAHLDGTVHALSVSTGETLWELKTQADDWQSAIGATRGGWVHLVTGDGESILLDADTGEERWRLQAP